MTQPELRQFLQQPYSREAWAPLLRTLFKRVDIFTAPQQLFEEQRLVKSGGQFGAVTLDDGKSIALFEVEVADGVVIERNRVALRGIAARYIDQYVTHGALVFYFSPKQPTYRFTFISKQSQFDEQGQLTQTETHPKRYTYLLGPNEPSATAAQRLLQLEAKNAEGATNIRTVVDAFSVEKLSKEFFKKYKEDNYNRFVVFLTGEDCNGKQVAEPHPYLQTVFSDDRRAAREFVKKLLGRTIFMFFLQKKGWLGCPADRKDWTGGDPRFVQNLFENCPEKAHFHSQCLTQLFYEALNKDRRDQNDRFDLTQNRVPFLNGGLFERDRRHNTAGMDFPPDFFRDLLAFLEQYNFTIDENSPDEQEIGIDPEMLGHIFENLLEDNKDKGAFYTPKEIVHYMCQESLVQYLQTHTPPELAADIETLIRLKAVPMNLSERTNARLLTDLLQQVKICDPAIGSGAFPIGLLQEIYRARLLLYPYTDPKTKFDPAAVKKSIIQNAIYGVDKDGGAVDIARLRFWLALVVDEESPQPLPNLDYKIMQGDSLLERFAGIRLDNLLQTEKVVFVLEHGQTDMFGKSQGSQAFSDEKKKNLEALLKDYFLPKQEDKASLKQQIDRIAHEHIEYNIELLEHSLYRQKNEAEGLRSQINFNKTDALGILKKKEKKSQDLQRQIDIRQKELDRLAIARAQLLEMEEKEADRPFFLWHLFFKEVFDAGGFDIVIGNPPYIQIQKLPADAKAALETADFKTYEKGSDLYCLFYERALQLLRPGGVLAFITSNSWMKTKYGERLRRYFVQESAPLALLNFEDRQLFEAAIVETNILIARKGLGHAALRAAVVGADADRSTPLHDLLAERGMDIRDLSEKEWIIGDAESAALKQKIETAGKRLVEWEVEINRGVTTGLNEAFVIDEATKNALIAEDPKSAEILKPVLRGRDLKKYSYESANLWLIFTRRGIDIARYAAVKKHLSKHKNGLLPKPSDWDGKTNANAKGEWLGRKGGPYQWYEIQDNTAYFEEFDKPKIIWAEISDVQKFVFDDAEFYTNNKCFIMVGEKLKFLLAILNSKVAAWYFDQISTTTGMGTTMWAKYKIEQLPIPEPSAAALAEVEGLVDGILAGKRSGADTAALESALDGLVFGLYGLSAAEAGYVLGALGR